MDGHNQRYKPQTHVQHRVPEARRVGYVHAAEPRRRQVRVAHVRAPAHVLHAPPGRAQRDAGRAQAQVPGEATVSIKRPKPVGQARAANKASGSM